MTWLVLGVLLWVGAHLFKRVLPKQRDALGKWGRPLVAVVSARDGEEDARAFGAAWLPPPPATEAPEAGPLQGYH